MTEEAAPPPLPIEASLPASAFKVRVSYVTQMGHEQEYIGSFRARNGNEALLLAGMFVDKYKRPSSIIATELQPIE